MGGSGYFLVAMVVFGGKERKLDEDEKEKEKEEMGGKRKSVGKILGMIKKMKQREP